MVNQNNHTNPQQNEQKQTTTKPTEAREPVNPTKQTRTNRNHEETEGTRESDHFEAHAITGSELKGRTHTHTVSYSSVKASGPLGRRDPVFKST